MGTRVETVIETGKAHAAIDRHRTTRIETTSHHDAVEEKRRTGMEKNTKEIGTKSGTGIGNETAIGTAIVSVIKIMTEIEAALPLFQRHQKPTSRYMGGRKIANSLPRLSLSI